MKQMGEASGVPIEPDEQTRLLDACLEIPGVIGGGVPGGECRAVLEDRSCLLTVTKAGGYDAIYLLVVDVDAPTEGGKASDTISQVESLWQGWKELSVCPLTSRADAGGLKFIEDVGSVKGLRAIL
jgi:phosphomevalonate kinase